MKKILFTLVILFLSLMPVYGQSAISTSKIGWDQDATTLIEAQGLTYKYYADASVTGVAFVTVSCVGTVSPYQCEVAFPAFTPGTHSITLTAGNLAGESIKSLPLGFTFVVIPTAPKNLKIK